jgi:hydroxypyruvate reductase
VTSVATAANQARREALVALFLEAVRSVSPEAVMPRVIPVPPRGRLAVIAVGKAAAEMVRVAQQRSSAPLRGLAVTRYGHVPGGFTRNVPEVELIEAGHPSPDQNSLRAGARALQIAQGLGADDHLLVLLSGGGSALLTAPAPGVDLAQKQEITRLLLRSGATIQEINTVRKRLSRVKGGRLAVAAAPARVTSWIISDVPGDEPSMVASGPTVADRASPEAAREVLERHGIVPPATVAAALLDPRNAAPSPNAPGLAGAEISILARAADALAAAGARAMAGGYGVTQLGDRLEGEARHLGAVHAALARRLARNGRRHAILSGGETTVTVVNPNGRGGRNLEYLLALALALAGAPGICALACDTDGIDGTDDAAGAVLFPDTLARARALGLDAAGFLAANDAYRFFERLGDLVVTGPTFTNVNDFRAILIDPENGP